MIKGKDWYYYDWIVIRAKGNQVEWAIYRYYPDGSLEDCEDLVILRKWEDIKKYIKATYC